MMVAQFEFSKDEKKKEMMVGDFDISEDKGKKELMVGDFLGAGPGVVTTGMVWSVSQTHPNIPKLLISQKKIIQS